MPSPVDDDLMGVTLSGYAIEAELPREAGMSLYQGRGTASRRRVAIRLLKNSVLQSHLLNLDHPHILPILALGEFKGSGYVINPLWESSTLEDVLADLLPYEQVMRWVAQIGSALDYAHQRGVLHGNLTPSAVLIDEYGNLYLTNFALPAPQPSVYSAPEIWLGGSAEVAADIYALGAIAYQMIAGRPPFEAEDRDALRASVLEALPPPPTRPDEAVTYGEDHPLFQALAKPPAQRFASAGAFVRALRKEFAARSEQPPDPLPALAQDKHDFERVTLWSSQAKLDSPPQAYHLPQPEAVIGCAWLPADDAFLTASAEGSIMRWRAQADQSVVVARTDQRIIHFSLAGERLAVLHPDQRASVWSTEGDFLQSLPLVGARRLGLAGNGLMMVSGHEDGSLRVWDLFSVRELAHIPAHTSAVGACCLSENGQLALSGGADGELCLWNVHSGEVLQQFQGHAAPITACDLKGELVFSGDADGELRVWDILMQDAPISLHKHTAAITACQIQQVGGIVLGGSASEDGTARLWNLRSGEEVRVFEAAGERVTCCALSNRYFVYGTGSGSLHVADHTRTTQPSGHSAKVTDLVYHDDSLFSVGADQTCQQTALPNGRRLFSLSLAALPRCVAATMQYVFIGYADGIVQCFDRERHRLRWEASAHHAAVNFLHVLDHRQLVSGGADGVLACWNTVNGARLSAVALKTANIRCGVPRQGLSIVGTQEGQVSAWDVMTGQLQHLYGSFDQPVMALALMGKVLVAGLADGRIVRWMDDDQAAPFIFQAHACPTAALALNTDARTLFSAGTDGTLCLWDLAVRQGLESWRSDHPITRAVWADAQTLVMGSESGELTCLGWILRR